MEQEIIEGNKLITEFMSHKVEGEFVLLHDKYNGRYHISNVKYNTSWNWLLPACNKFINETTPPKESRDANVYRSFCNELYNIICDFKIEPVFKHLAKAIKWYNQQKTN